MEERFETITEKGEYTGETASREECHKKGIWHKAVALFIINSKNEVLLQKRSSAKKMWPNTWDITAGGHVLENELGFQSVIRETKEEIGIELDKNDLIFIGTAISSNKKGDIIDNHFNEFYIARKDLDESKLVLQEEEVSDVKWISREEITRRLENNHEGITDKKGCWEYLIKYYQWNEKNISEK